MNNFDELKKRVTAIHEGVDGEKKKKQHQKNKLTAKERIDLLYDKDTFVETNIFVEHTCHLFGMEQHLQEGDGVITGYGKVDGRTVCVYAQDFTVFGGSISESNARKISSIQKFALEHKVPIVGLFDSGGARIQEGISSLAGHGNLFYNNTQASGVIPQISAIMGPCAGGASYSPALTDFVFMVEDTSTMFITGPGVVKETTGQEITSRELGGSVIHSQVSGVAHFVVKDDKTCIEEIKKLLQYLPASYEEVPNTIPYKKMTNDLYKKTLNEIVPENSRLPYDMKHVIRELVDAGSFYEVHAAFAQTIITGFARMNGYVVGIVANQPLVMAGCIDSDAGDKAARFIRTCDCFNIPLVNLVDVPGFMPGKEQEYKGIIRHGAKMLFAYSESQVLKITVILRKAYGGSYLAMCSKEMGADFVLAWTSAEIAVMGAEGAIGVLYKKEIQNSEDPQKRRDEKIQEYRDTFLNPFMAAHVGYVDEVIEPANTRKRMIQILSNCYSEQVKHKSFHRNIPL